MTRSAFCVSAYNLDGTRHNDPNTAHVACNSSGAGLGVECDAI